MRLVFLLVIGRIAKLCVRTVLEKLCRVLVLSLIIVVNTATVLY